MLSIDTMRELLLGMRDRSLQVPKSYPELDVVMDILLRLNNPIPSCPGQLVTDDFSYGLLCDALLPQLFPFHRTADLAIMWRSGLAEMGEPLTSSLFCVQNRRMVRSDSKRYCKAIKTILYSAQSRLSEVHLGLEPTWNTMCLVFNAPIHVEPWTVPVPKYLKWQRHVMVATGRTILHSTAQMLGDQDSPAVEATLMRIGVLASEEMQVDSMQVDGEQSQDDMPIRELVSQDWSISEVVSQARDEWEVTAMTQDSTPHPSVEQNAGAEPVEQDENAEPRVPSLTVTRTVIRQPENVPDDDEWSEEMHSSDESSSSDEEDDDDADGTRGYIASPDHVVAFVAATHHFQPTWSKIVPMTEVRPSKTCLCALSTRTVEPYLNFQVIKEPFCVSCAPSHWTPGTFLRQLDYAAENGLHSISLYYPKSMTRKCITLKKTISIYCDRKCPDLIQRKVCSPVVDQMNRRTAKISSLVGSHLSLSELKSLHSLGVGNKITSCKGCRKLISTMMDFRKDAVWRTEIRALAFEGHWHRIFVHLHQWSVQEKNLYELFTGIITDIMDCCRMRSGYQVTKEDLLFDHDKENFHHAVTFVHLFLTILNTSQLYTTTASLENPKGANLSLVGADNDLMGQTYKLAYIDITRTMYDCELADHSRVPWSLWTDLMQLKPLYGHDLNTRNFPALYERPLTPRSTNQSKFDVQNMLWKHWFVNGSLKIVKTCFSCNSLDHHRKECLLKYHSPELYINTMKVLLPQRVHSFHLNSPYSMDNELKQQFDTKVIGPMTKAGFFCAKGRYYCTYCAMSVPVERKSQDVVEYTSQIRMVHMVIDSCPGVRFRTIANCDVCGEQETGCKLCTACKRPLCVDCLGQMRSDQCPFCRTIFNMVESNSCQEAESFYWTRRDELLSNLMFNKIYLKGQPMQLNVTIDNGKTTLNVDYWRIIRRLSQCETVQ